MNILSHRQVLVGATATHELAYRIGQVCCGGELILLIGELGTGKTAFAKGLAQGLGCDPRAVKSPTFTMHMRHLGRKPLNHYDLYMTRAVEDLERTSFREFLAAGEVVAIEWAERFPAEFHLDRLEIRLEHRDADSRDLTVAALGPVAQRLFSRAGLGSGENAQLP